MADSFLVPVPPTAPQDGAVLIVQIPNDWIPAILAALNQMRNPSFWDNPPDDIIGQVDELTSMLITPID